MKNLYVVPVLVAAAVVLVVYMMKKNEEDEAKRPNYPVLFLTCLVFSGGVVYFMNGDEDNLQTVLKEIHGGDVPF